MIRCGEGNRQEKYIKTYEKSWPKILYGLCSCGIVTYSSAP